MGKKWYVCYRSAEGNACFVIDLTDEEKEVIQRFIDAQDGVYDEGYSGCFGFEPDGGPFNTKREAVEWMVKESDCCAWKYRRLPSEEIEKLIDKFTNGGKE